MLHFIKKGTQGKLIHRTDYGVEVKDWVVRKDLYFENVLLTPTKVLKERGRYDPKHLLTKMALKGYSIYSGKDGDLADSPFYLAIQHDDVGVAHE